MLFDFAEELLAGVGGVCLCGAELIERLADGGKAGGILIFREGRNFGGELFGFAREGALVELEVDQGFGGGFFYGGGDGFFHLRAPCGATL